VFLVIFGTFGTVVTFGTPVTCEPDMCCQPHRFPFVTDNSSCRQVPLVDYSFSESDSDCIVPGVDDDIDCDTSHMRLTPNGHCMITMTMIHLEVFWRTTLPQEEMKNP